jgi:3,4-dihydroxy 2-butanone 4-phosphate synthase/GTP cyclohydrolase II
MAAERITPEAIHLMSKFGRRLICLAMTEERRDALCLGPMSIETLPPSAPPGAPL